MQRLSSKTIAKRKREAELGRAITEGIRAEAEAAIHRMEEHRKAHIASVGDLITPYVPPPAIELTEDEREALRVANNRAILQTGAAHMDPVALRNLRREREASKGKTKQAAASEAMKDKVQEAP